MHCRYLLLLSLKSTNSYLGMHYFFVLKNTKWKDKTGMGILHTALSGCGGMGKGWKEQNLNYI